MRVRVLARTRVYWNYAIEEVEKGTELVGEFARHLADNAPAGNVEVLEADPAPKAPPAAPAAGPADKPAPDGGETPPVDGTIDDLMKWVDGDPDRAGQALAAEQAKDKPRATVVKRLTALVGSSEE